MTQDDLAPETTHAYRILLVDDDSLLSEAVANILQMEGHSVSVAPDGPDAPGHTPAECLRHHIA